MNLLNLGLLSGPQDTWYDGPIPAGNLECNFSALNHFCTTKMAAECKLLFSVVLLDEILQAGTETRRTNFSRSMY